MKQTSGVKGVERVERVGEREREEMIMNNV